MTHIHTLIFIMWHITCLKKKRLPSTGIAAYSLRHKFHQDLTDYISGSLISFLQVLISEVDQASADQPDIMIIEGNLLFPPRPDLVLNIEQHEQDLVDPIYTLLIIGSFHLVETGDQQSHIIIRQLDLAHE